MASAEQLPAGADEAGTSDNSNESDEIMMIDETNDQAAPAPAVKKAVAKKAPVKKAAPKKVPAKAVAKKAPAKAAAKKAAVAADPDRKTDTTHTRGEREDMVVKALRKMNAINATNAVGKDALAAKAGLSPFDTYGVVWSKSRLQVEGFVKQAAVEGIRGAAFYLTAKGQKHLPSE